MEREERDPDAERDAAAGRQEHPPGAPAPVLNLPSYPFQIRELRGRTMIFDPLRQRYVRLTPEEWVRQHFVQYLIRECGYPRALIAVEMAFTYQGMPRRADVVVHDRRGRPLLLVECKAPEVEVRQATFDQAARYNLVIQAGYLVVTNGLVHYCCVLDRAQHTYRFLEALPRYEEL